MYDVSALFSAMTCTTQQGRSRDAGKQVMHARVSKCVRGEYGLYTSTTQAAREGAGNSTHHQAAQFGTMHERIHHSHTRMPR
jgi:hypothetical protein